MNLNELIDALQAKTEALDAKCAELERRMSEPLPEFISPAQAAGLLDINPATLSRSGIPRYPVAPKVIRYRKDEVLAFLAARRER